jgi:hypothetical protein
MADKSSLRLLGFVFACVSLAVSLTATLVVREYVTGRLHLVDVAIVQPDPTTAIQ